MLKALISQFAALSLLFLMTGCKTKDEVKVNNSLTVDADMIKNMDIDRDHFTEYVDDQIDVISVDIIAGTKNRITQRAAIEMKKFFNKRLHKYENIEDPRKAFLNTWSLVYRFENYINDGEGKSIFGGQQEHVVKTFSTILFQLEKRAGKHLTPKQLKRVKKDLKNYAAEYPVKGYFQDTPEVTSSGFVDFLNIPMAPFRAVTAINKSGESIADISKTVARFTDIAEDLPEEIRWQLQVLAVQLQQNDILKTNTESFAKLAETSEALVKIVDKYPDKVSDTVKLAAKDLETTVNRLKTISEQVDKSMAKLQASSENFKSLGSNINQSTDKIITSLKQVDQSSQSLTKAAEAVSKAVQNIQTFSEHIAKNDDTDNDPGEESFLLEVRKASEALEKASNEITNTLDKVIELSQSKPFSEQLNSFDQKAQKTVTMTRQESQTLVDYIFKKALILAGIIFILSLIVVITKSRLNKKAE